MSAERSHDTAASPLRSVGRASRPSKRSPVGPAASHSSVGSRSPELTGVACRLPRRRRRAGTRRRVAPRPALRPVPRPSDRSAGFPPPHRAPASRTPLSSRLRSGFSSRDPVRHRAGTTGCGSAASSSTTSLDFASPSADVDATARSCGEIRGASASIAAESAVALAVRAHSVATRAGRSGSVGITHTRRPRRRALGTASKAATPYEPGVSGCSSRVTVQLPACGSWAFVVAGSVASRVTADDPRDVDLGGTGLVR